MKRIDRDGAPRRWTRREALARTGAAAGLGLLGGCAAWRESDSAPMNPLSGESLYRDVVNYTRLGDHRTAHEGDRATSDWMAERLEAAGVETEFQPWSLRQAYVDEARVRLGRAKFEAEPLWYPRLTGEEPLAGQLAPFEPGARADLHDKIALVKTTYGRLDVVAKAIAAGAKGVVLLTEHHTGGLFMHNASAPHNQQSWGAPVLCVGQHHAEALQSAAGEGHEVSLLVMGEEKQAVTARNVIGRIDRGERLIVVSTPQSGWFQCAGERGPGIALFLGLARWAAAGAGDTSYLFISTSGHELDNIGMHHFMHETAPPPERVSCWIHLGASIATREWDRGRRGWTPTPRPNMAQNLVCSHELLGPLTEAFAEVDFLNPRGGEARGELRHALAAGYRAFGFFGGHHWFHTPSDEPRSTGPEFLEPVGLALARAIEAIERG